MHRYVLVLSFLLPLSGCSLVNAYEQGDAMYQQHYARGTDGTGACYLSDGINKQCIDGLTRNQCMAHGNAQWTAIHDVGHSCK